jgi:hypothetical protein
MTERPDDVDELDSKPEKGHSIITHAHEWGPGKRNSIGNGKGQKVHAWEAAADKIHPVGRK